MRRLLYLALWALAAGGAGAETPIEPLRFDDPAQEARFKQLTSELRCLVCQNQSLADSEAPLAMDLRHEIHKMMLAGASNKEIVDFLVARYGDFVLFRPPVKPTTYLLWLGPLILFVLGLAVFAYVLRHGHGSEPRLTEAERRRARRLLADPKEGAEP